MRQDRKQEQVRVAEQNRRQCRSREGEPNGKKDRNSAARDRKMQKSQARGLERSIVQNTIPETSLPGVRLNKYLAETGMCSRREADRLIESGRVTVDGVTAAAGSRVQKGQKVCVDQLPVKKEREVIMLAVNKPAGVVCTTDKKWGDQTLEDMVGYPKRVFSVGRLDKDSEGLILMTNQGDMLNKII